jgi:predicted site-specific integrase-resolvase
MPPQKQHFRLDEFASKFNVSTKSVYRWIKTGTLPAVKFKGVYAIEREVFERVSTEGLTKPAKKEE